MATLIAAPLSIVWLDEACCECAVPGGTDRETVQRRTPRNGAEFSVRNLHVDAVCRVGAFLVSI